MRAILADERSGEVTVFSAISAAPSSHLAVSRARDDNPGLLRFKAGLGAREVEHEVASFCPKPFVKRKVHTAFRTGLAGIKP